VTVVKRAEKAAAIIGIGGACAGAVTLFVQLSRAMSKILTVEVLNSAEDNKPHGTTDPAPGTYSFGVNDKVTITAEPETDYLPGMWFVDLVEMAQAETSLTVTMDTDHTVWLDFWLHGEPPASAFHHLEFSVPGNIIQNVGVAAHGNGNDLEFFVKRCDEHWFSAFPDPDKIPNGLPRFYPVKITAIDVNGSGLSGFKIAVWTDFREQTRYRGMLKINDKEHTQTAPLTVTTNKDGNAFINVNYDYGVGLVQEEYPYKLLTKDADVMMGITVWYGPVQYWPGDGEKARWVLGYVITSMDGDCSSGEAPHDVSQCAIWNSPAHQLLAKPATGVYQPQVAFLNCGFHVKWTKNV